MPAALAVDDIAPRRARLRRNCDDSRVPDASSGDARLTLPGFVNAHCHAFQRALRGRAGGGDFWAWRELMLGEAERQTPDSVHAEYTEVYRELRRAGYTAVGEFHYLGFDEALAAVDAAREAQIEIVLLLAAYARGGLDRFRQTSVQEYLAQIDDLCARGIRVGVAPHSVRACPADWLEQIGAYASAQHLPLHVHADEQPREIDECLREGFLPVERVCTRAIGICIGSDSNVRIDPLEELRELEGIARRQAGRRNIISVGSLLCFGADEGAGALGLERWDDVEVNADHPSLRGVGDVYAALVWGCSADVFVCPTSGATTPPRS